MTVDELLAEARLWDGARIAHLDQARSSMTRIAELERQIAAHLAEGERLARLARRDLEACRVGLERLPSLPSMPAAEK